MSRGQTGSGASSARLAERGAALRDALDAGGHRLDPAAARAGRDLLSRLGERVRLSADHTVVALAGATGSGKSSLFNAISRLDLAKVGARRPTTSATMACVWGTAGAEPLLDWLAVPTQHRVSRESALGSGGQALQGLVLLDLPDYDSTQDSHRIEVDRLVELVDVFVWVTDPQKYADAVLHRRYLSRLAGHDAVTVIVLNQADRLDGESLEACRRDLTRLVAADGLPDVRVLTTSATTGAGVEQLREVIAAAVGRRSAWAQRLLADIDAAVVNLRGGVGDEEPAAEGLSQNTGLLAALADAAGVPVVVRAVEQDYVREAVGRAGWPLTRWTRHLRADPLRRLRLRARGSASATSPRPQLQRSSLPAATAAQRSQVQAGIGRMGDAAADGLPDRWASAVRAAARPPGGDLDDALDQAVVGADLPLRRPVWWSMLGALQIVLALATALGLVWLIGLAVTGWLRLPEPRTPYVGPVPVPTVLLVGGLAMGALVGGVVRLVAGVGARRRGARVRRLLEAAIASVARERLIGPVAQVLTDHRTTREALERAAP